MLLILRPASILIGKSNEIDSTWNKNDGIVNTASIDPINNENEYQQLLEQINEIRVGRHFFNPLSVVGFS